MPVTVCAVELCRCTLRRWQSSQFVLSDVATGNVISEVGDI